MTIIELPQFTLPAFISGLSPYQLPGSTVDYKMLGAPYEWGRIRLVYEKLGLTVMRSDIRLGAEMMLVKAGANAQQGLDELHTFEFISMRAGTGISFINAGGQEKMATGSSHLFAHSVNSKPMLANYSPRYNSSSLHVQVSRLWLQEHMPNLAAICGATGAASILKPWYEAPPSMLTVFNADREIWDDASVHHAEGSIDYVIEFLKHFHSAAIAASDSADPDPAGSSFRRQMDAFIKKILSNLHEPLPTAEKMSALSGININTLRAGFKKVYGQSLSAYFTTQQMAWARKALSKQDASVKEVGYSIGYKNLSHFAQHFQKYQGLLPGEVKLVNL